MWRLESFKHVVGSKKMVYQIPMLLGLWDSRAKNEHWIREQWPKRNAFTVGEKNILNQSVVSPDKVLLLLPRLHINLSLMKQ